MTAATTFPYEDCELDFGSFCLGGDWLLTVETSDDGFSFQLVDAASCGKGVSKATFALIQEWIDNDTSPRARGSEHVSRIRKAHQAYLADRTPDDAADDLGCFRHHERRAA